MPTAMITGGVSAVSAQLSPGRSRRPTRCSLRGGPSARARCGRRGVRRHHMAGRPRRSRRDRNGGRTDRRARRADPQRRRRLSRHASRSRPSTSGAPPWRSTWLGRWHLRCALLPALRTAGGHVVFVNSGAGINASPGLASYSASKFALRGFADSLRNDEPSLRVTSVHPGRIATEMQEKLVAYEGREYDAGAIPQPGDCRQSHRRRGQRAPRRPHPRGHRPSPRVISVR